MRPRLTVLAALLITIGACDGPATDVTAPVQSTDAKAPVSGPLRDNTNTDVRLTITPSGPDVAAYGSQPTLTAQATLNGAPVANVQLVFYLHEFGEPANIVAGCTANTGADGIANCQFYPLQINVGQYQLDVLLGTAGYFGGVINQIFTVIPAPTTLTYTGPTTFTSSTFGTVTLSARLTWSLGSLPVGTTVFLEMDDQFGDALVFCTTQTDPFGVFQCTVSTFLAPGPITLRATYQGAHLFQASSVNVPGVIVQAMPTTADQCKGAGWMQYGRFKNQGDCVSWIVTNGKNAPAF